MGNSREKLVKKAISQIASEEMGGITNAIADNALAEDELEVYKNMTADDWYKDIYESLLKLDKVYVSGGYIEIKEDIKFLGKERIFELIKENEIVQDCLEELDSLLA